MRWPFITKVHHEEVVALQKAQILALEDDRRHLIDHLQKIMAGDPVYKEKPQASPEVVAAAQPQNQQQERLDMVRQAMMATGSRSPAKIAAWITGQNEKRYYDRQRQMEAPDNVKAVLDEDEAQGRANAGVTQ